MTSRKVTSVGRVTGATGRTSEVATGWRNLPTSMGPPPQFFVEGSGTPGNVNASATLAPQTARGPIIALENSTNIISTTSVPGIATLTSFGPIVAAVFPADVELLQTDNQNVYQLTGSGVASRYNSAGVNTNIGSIAPPAGQTFTDLATDPTTGTVYAASTNCSTTSTLSIVDLATAGPRVPVGDITVGAPATTCIVGLAADNLGNLFGYDIITDTMLSISKITGLGTTLGPLGFDANFGQGMDCDPASGSPGTCYLFALNNTTGLAELRTANLITGATAFVANIGSASPGGSPQVAGAVFGTIGLCTADAQCVDAVFCNGTETCNVGTGECQPGTAPACDDTNVCTSDSCVTTQVVYSENFETGGTGWTHAVRGAGADTWHIAASGCFGDPFTSNMYVSNGNAGPACVSSTTVETSQLLSPPILLPAGNLTLSLQALSFDEGGSCTTSADFDRHDVGVSIDGGATYTILNNCTPIVPGGGTLVTQTYSLSPFAGQLVQIIVVYDTIDDFLGDTFAVDNVNISIPVDACVNTPANNGGVCNDNNATTCNDVCGSGTCAGTFVPAPTEINDSVRLAHSPAGTAGTTTISWTDAPGPYNVYRGSIPAGGVFPPAYNHTCFDPNKAASPSTDTTSPPTGGAFYYLVSRKALCRESSLGRDSANNARPNNSPCPP